MEWVETTGKTVEAAREAALDQLGVAAEEAEFDVIDEPRPGLFGRLRGEARVRARIKPAPVRPKQERRRRSRSDRPTRGARGLDDRTASDDQVEAPSSTTSPPDTTSPDVPDVMVEEAAATSTTDASGSGSSTGGGSGRRRGRRGGRGRGGGHAASSPRIDAPSPRTTDDTTESTTEQEPAMSNDSSEPTVSPQEVGDAAVAFVDGLTEAFGVTASSSLSIDGTELDVRVTGTELGLLVGSGGRTLNAIQDLARVAAQRRLGDHDTRLRIDVAGYRERRKAALERFAREVAAQVRETGSARSLEPMSSADRKVIHDTLNDEPGVASRSEGDDPARRVVVVPA